MTRKGSEAGMSLIEVTMSGAVAAIVVAAFLAMYAAFQHQVRREDQRAAALAVARPVVARLASELRQAVDGDGDGTVIELLDGGTVVFDADRLDDAPGPERYRYELVECSGGRCDLRRTVVLADPGGPPWTYRGSGSTQVVLRGVGDDPPLFVGITMVGSDQVTVTSCGVGDPCSIELVRIDLRIAPAPADPGTRPVQILREARLRNVP